MKTGALLALSLVLLPPALFGAPAPATSSTAIPIACEVVSADGKPVAGADVFVCSPPSREKWLDQPIIAQGKTDADGWFRSSFTAPAHWEFFYASVIVNAGDRGIGVGKFSTNLSSTRPVNPCKITLLPTANFEATILTPDGKPAAGLEVWVDYYALPNPKNEPFSMYGQVTRLPGSFWNARTDDTGKCVIASVPRGASIYLAHGDSRWAQLHGRHNILQPTASKADGISVTLNLVQPGSIRGRILLPDKTPASGSIVSIIERIPYVTSFGAAIKASENGEFVFDQIPPSTYHLTFTIEPPFRADWIGSEKKNLVVNAGEVTDLGDLFVTPVAIVTARVVNADTNAEVEPPLIFRLAAGQHDLRYGSMRYPDRAFHPPGRNDAVHVVVKDGERQTITFKLVPVKAEDAVVGTVLDPVGVPVADASIILMGDSFSLEFAPPSKTGKDGSFRFVRPKDADRLVLLAWQGDTAMSAPMLALPGKPSVVKLRDKGWAKVTGRVTDESGHAIKGAKISWYCGGISYQAGPVPHSIQSDADGNFEFPRFWGDGDHTTFFGSADGYGGAAFRNEKLENGKTTRLKMIFKTANQSVAGTVVDAVGKPVAGIMVLASGDDQPSGAKAETDAQGRFRIDHVCAGDVSLRTLQKEKGTANGEARQWAKSGATDVLLKLPAADGAAAGVVVDFAGKPVPFAKLSAYDEGRTIEATADASGRFALSGIVKGWLSVDVHAPNTKGETIEHRARLKSGTKDARIDMPAKNRDVSDWPVTPLNLIGKLAPDIQVTTWLHSDPLPLKAGGKVRILDFWGVECGPCIAGFPKVQQFWEAHQHENLEIIALTGFYPAEEVKEFFAKHPTWKFPVALEPDDSTSSRDYDVRGIPTYVVIDPQGKIVSKSHDWQEATTIALKLLQPQP